MGLTTPGPFPGEAPPWQRQAELRLAGLSHPDRRGFVEWGVGGGAPAPAPTCPSLSPFRAPAPGAAPGQQRPGVARPAPGEADLVSVRSAWRPLSEAPRGPRCPLPAPAPQRSLGGECDPRRGPGRGGIAHRPLEPKGPGDRSPFLSPEHSGATARAGWAGWQSRPCYRTGSAFGQCASPGSAPQETFGSPCRLSSSRDLGLRRVTPRWPALEMEHLSGGWLPL